jgi:hypothetical protein
MNSLFAPCLLIAASLTFAPVRWAVDTQPPPKQVPLPRSQRVRVNDTLALIFSRPYGRFTVAERPTLLWGRAVLHGRRGYRQDLADGLLDLYSARSVVVHHRPDVLHIERWRKPSPPALEAGQPPALDYRDFVYYAWDVRYRTNTTYLDADLAELPIREYGDFLRDPDTQVHAYHLPPYWLTRERARARRTRRLPQAHRLAQYLALSRCIETAYYPQLTRLLQAYAACPMPAATARQVAQAQRTLAQVH